MSIQPSKIKTKFQKIWDITKHLPIKQEINHLYTTNEDFTRMNPKWKRLLILGCTGSGKSTLLNKLAGYKLKWDETLTKLKWTTCPLFESHHGVESITKIVSYGNIVLDVEDVEDQPSQETTLTNLIVIDTPGHDDSHAVNLEQKESRDKLSEQAADLYTKLKSMGYLNTILVIHNDVYSNRLNPVTYNLLQKIDQMFKESSINVWEHVIIAYSKCDHDSFGWRDDLEGKISELQGQIREKFPSCNLDVPVFTFTGVELGDTKPKVDKLVSFLLKSSNLPTNQLVKFEGLDAKLEKLTRENHYIQRVSDARLNFVQNTVFSLVLLLLFCFRNLFLGFLDIPGLYDELIYIFFFVYIMGPMKYLDWLMVGWDDYLIPILEKKKLILNRKDWSLLGKIKQD